MEADILRLLEAKFENLRQLHLRDNSNERTGTKSFTMSAATQKSKENPRITRKAHTPNSSRTMFKVIPDR